MRRGLLLLAALAVVAVVAARATILQVIGNFLAVQDPLVTADAVIAISGDGQERVRTAAALLEQGYARWLILSGAPLGSGSAVELLRYARRFHVPEDRVLLDERATTTYENALGSARVMQARGLQSAILVTSPYHMRRAVVEFRAVFSRTGMTVRAFPAQDSFFQVGGWWTRGRDRDLVIREYLKLLAFLVGIH